jgi:hypothetical protein
VSTKHTIVPRGFGAAELERCIQAGKIEKFERITARQARALAQAGIIQQLGESGKVWQRTEDLPVRADYETGKGRVSLEIPRNTRRIIASEMRRKPLYEEEVIA